MKRASVLTAVILLTNSLAAAAAGAAPAPLKRIANAAGDTVAVLVPANVTIQHTRQYFDSDPANLLTELELPPGRAVKLNVYAATPAAADAARAAIRKHFSADERPAVSVVVGSMPRPDMVLAIDSIV